jgi:hypothetical protein
MSLTVISVPFKECKTMNGLVQENKKTKNLKHFIFIVCSKDISWSENFIFEIKNDLFFFYPKKLPEKSLNFFYVVVTFVVHLDKR